MTGNSRDVFDPFSWLENLEDPKVVDWASERDKTARTALKAVSERLYPRIEKYYLFPYAIMAKASRKGYFVLVREGGAFKIKLMTSDGGINELVDSKKLGENAVIKALYTAKGGERYSFSYSHGGSDEGFLNIVDTESGFVLDQLEGVVGDITWIGDDEYYYVRSYRKGTTPDGVVAPAERVFLRESGRDELVFGEGIPTSHFISLKKSVDETKGLLKVSYGWSRSSVYAGELEQPEIWECLTGGDDFVISPIDYIDGAYLVASYDEEGLGRIVAVTEGGEMEEVVGDQGYTLQEAVVAENRLVASYLVDASSTLRMFRLDGERLDVIGFEPPGTIDSLDTDGDRCVFRYQSFLIPHRIYILEEGKMEILTSEEVQGSYDVEEGWVTSKDRTKIHAFKVKRRNIEPKQALAYGYGGFSIALAPRFFPHIIPFIEDGGVFIQANLRGGSEYGEKWHRAGMREKKQNVFDDFISVIEHLKERNAQVVAMGVSNGGLLVGAVLTQRPDLLDGAVIGYPVLDMLRFHNLYIGRAWAPEYGDPENAEDAAYLSKYSPYNNISDGSKYPPTLLYTGLYDDRVHSAHAFKFVAKLEEAKANYLLRVEEKSGHAGATPKTKIKEYSDIMAFVYKALDM